MLPLALLVLSTSAPLPQTSPHVVTVRAVELRCEALTEPLFVGERKPHLSFVLEPSDPAARGQLMSAWQVRAGHQPGGSELWDSGRVSSSDPTAVEWNGRDLTSGLEVHWAVRVWDEKGFVGPWSEPASFTMGLLDESDWSAQWIGWDAPLASTQRPLGLEGAQWIGLPTDELTGAPTETRYFRTAFDVPRDSPLASAALVATADHARGLRQRSADRARAGGGERMATHEGDRSHCLSRARCKCAGVRRAEHGHRTDGPRSEARVARCERR